MVYSIPAPMLLPNTLYADHRMHSLVDPTELLLQVVGMTRTAAIEYAQSGIQVAAVAPGAIKTDILNDAIAAGAYSEESIASMFPMKKMGKPLDVAQAISFLLHSDYATGSILEVDGGLGAA